MLCGFHNHDVVEILVDHPYVGRLMNYEKTMLVDMSKSMVKSKNILLKLKEHNEKNVTTIRQLYTARITYRRSQKAPKTKMQHLMNLLEHDMHIHWHVMNDEEVVRDNVWTHLDAVKLLNAFNNVLDGYNIQNQQVYATFA